MSAAEHLQGRLRAIARAAQGSPEGGYIAALLPRLRTIQRQLLADGGDGGPPEPIPDPDADARPVEAFRAAVTAAEAAGLPEALTDYLANAAHRLERLRLPPGERRLARRYPEDRAGRLEEGPSSTDLLVADSSPFGLGILLEQPLAPGDPARVVVPEVRGGTTFECVAVHTRPEGIRYRVGLEVFRVRI